MSNHEEPRRQAGSSRHQSKAWTKWTRRNNNITEGGAHELSYVIEAISSTKDSKWTQFEAELKKPRGILLVWSPEWTLELYSKGI